MKRVLAAFLLAVILSVCAGCSTAPRLPRDQGYGGGAYQPADGTPDFEWRKATSGAITDVNH